LRYWEEYSKTVGGVATTPPSFSPALGGSVRQELGSVRQTHRRTTQIRTKQEKGQQQSGSSINMKSENETKDVVDSSLISKIVKEYKAITGQEDLTPRLLRQRLSKLNNLELTEEYIDEKMLLLKQSLEKTKNPAGFFITAIIEDWKPVLDIDDTTKKQNWLNQLARIAACQSACAAVMKYKNRLSQRSCGLKLKKLLSH
jgi:hypothetical protein